MVRALWAWPGLASAALHGAGLAIRLGFMFAVLLWSGPTLLGEYGLLISIEVVAIYLAGFEFHTFTTRRYARRPGETSLARSLAGHRRLLLISAPLAMAGSAGAAWALGLDLTPFELVAFMVVIATGTIVQDLIRFIVMARDPVMSIVAGFCRQALWLPFALIFLGSANPLEWMLLCWAIAAVLSLAIGVWVLRSAIWRPHRLKRRYLVQGLNVARNYHITASASVLQGNMERFVIQSFLGPEAVGIFAFFQNLANTLPAFVQAAVLNLWLPNLLSDFGQKRAERFVTVRRVIKRAAAVSIITSVGILVGSVVLSALTKHLEYLSTIWILLALLVGQIAQMVTQPIHLALYGAHRDRALMRMSLALLSLSLLLSVALVAAFGITGAVISQVITGLAIASGRMGLFRFYSQRSLL